ncbi:hypothetical protein TcWFU_007811 [Taenia crassiceps]|uniref:Uncharacterized protein n=1 Tax=Taenia crassiceps TaxID=6207 RepID=A0ABR4PZM3_9CEST
MLQVRSFLSASEKSPMAKALSPTGKQGILLTRSSPTPSIALEVLAVVMPSRPHRERKSYDLPHCRRQTGDCSDQGVCGSHHAKPTWVLLHNSTAFKLAARLHGSVEPLPPPRRPMQLVELITVNECGGLNSGATIQCSHVTPLVLSSAVFILTMRQGQLKGMHRASGWLQPPTYS